jgi:thiol-disulfide isomerase/thioredoxin
MNVALLGLRITLAAVFLLAAVGKFRDLRGTVEALGAFGVPEGVARWAGPGLPLAELGAATLLLLEPLAGVGAGLALALLLLFIMGIARSLARGEAPDCHCFGQIHSEPAGVSTLIRNGLLSAAAAVILLLGRGPAIGASLSGSGTLLLATTIIASVLTIVCLALWSERTRLTGELERTLQARQPPGLPAGVLAPPFQIEAVRGSASALEELLGLGTPVILVFASTTCGPCLEMFPVLAHWQDAVSHSLTIAALFSGPRDDVERLSEEHDLTMVMRQRENEIFETYALRATPSAVLLAADGTIQGPAVEGAGAIETLIRTSLAAPLRVQPVPSSA